MAKRTKKLSRPQLKLEALEQRQLLAGVTGGGTEVGSNINHSNGNVYDQVLMTGSSVTITADAGQVTRVSFLDLQGDIVQAEFSGKGSLTISLDQFTKDVAPANYNQAGVKYSQGLASFTVSGSDSSTNFAVFSVGKGNAVNAALFDTTHQGGDHTADVARLTIVADPANPNGSDFGAIYAGNAKFSADSGVVGITASNVQVQNAVRIGDVDAKTSATPTLVFGTHSQFAAIDVAGGDLISSNGKAVNNKLSYEYGVNLLAGTDSNGTTLPAQVATPTFTDHDPFVGTAAKTLSLTSGNDAGSLFIGTAGDDTYIASIGSNGIPTNGTTLNPGDSLNGGGGNDTLSISISGTNTANQTTASFTANNIEWLSIANFQTDDAFNSIIDLAGAPQVKAVTVTSSSASGDTELSSIQNIVDASMKNGAGDLTLTYLSSVVAGTADTQKLGLSSQTAGTFTANGIETFAITSDTAANTVTLVGDAVKTLTVTGDKSLTLGTLPGTVTKVDASGLTAGSLSLTGSAAVNYNIIGGAGNDSITLQNFTSSDSVDGGAGTDTLSVDSTGAFGQSVFGKVTNVETVKLTGAAANVTLTDNISATTFDLSTVAGTQYLTLDKASNGSTAYSNATTVILTNNGAGADKVINTANVALTINAKDADLANVTLTGGSSTDVLNLASSGGSLTTTNIGGFETINVTGSSGSTITVADGSVGSGKTLTIDGSTKSGGALTVDGSGVTSGGILSVNGGAGADILTGGTSGKDTLVGGAGNDSFKLSQIKATNIVTGGDGTDILELTAANSISASSALAGVTGVETLKVSADTNVTLDANITGTTGIATIDLGTNTNVLTLKSGVTDAFVVKFSAGDKVDNQANTSLTLNAATASLTAATTLIGGSGSDVINLTADSDATGATLTNVSGVETIKVLPDSSDATKTAKITAGAVNTLVAAGKTLVIDASALTNSSSSLTFVGNSAETDGFLSVVGSAGADAITGGGSGFDTLLGGGGNDTITLASLQPTNVVDGGAGTDTLVVNGTISTSSAFLGVKNVESLQLGSAVGLTLTSNIAASTGITSINAATGGANVISLTGGYTDATTVSLDSGDKITNSTDVALTVNIDSTAFGATTTIAGGKGTDVINVSGKGGTVDLTAVTGVETINITKPSAGNAATTLNVAAAGVVASGKTMTIDGSGMSDALTINGSAVVAADGSLVIKGGSGADTITGGANADTFTGGDGNDVFTLSAHANKLTFDTITDLASGDKLSGADTGTDTFVSTKITLGSFATFSDYLDAAANQGTTTAGANTTYAWFVYGGNTYVVRDISTNATFTNNVDQVIEIKGVKDLSSSTENDTGVLSIVVG